MTDYIAQLAELQRLVRIRKDAMDQFNIASPMSGYQIYHIAKTACMNVDAALDRLAAGPDVGDGWMLVNDEARRSGVVLVGRQSETWGFIRGYGRFETIAGISGWICRGFVDPPGDLGLGHPTHWQPLPAPPKEP